MNKNLTIFQINDTHGYLESHQEVFWSSEGEVFREVGGYARISAIFRKERCLGHPVFAFDSGDTFHGTYHAVKSKGEALISPLNFLELDAMTGHWDFAYGPKQLKSLVSRLNYPFLAINCYEKDTKQLFFPPYVVLEREGIKLGVIGIAATIVDKTMPEHFSEGLYFTLGVEELPQYIETLKIEKKVDLIVVISHLGYPQDVKLASEISGIDVLLSGHTHNRLFEPVVVNGATIIQSGCHGSFVGKLDIEIHENERPHIKHTLITVEKEIEPDAEMQSLIDKILKGEEKELNKSVGKTKTSLHRNTMLSAPMDDLLLSAIVEASGAEIGFSNGWRYGAPIPEGEVTVNDLWNLIPGNPPVSTVDLTGREIRELLEDNIEKTFCPDPFGQMGGYLKRLYGIKLFLKVENPKGCRIQDIFVNGVTLIDTKSYKAAFVTAQGVGKTFGVNRVDLNLQAIDALKAHLKNQVFESKSQNLVVLI